MPTAIETFAAAQNAFQDTIDAGISGLTGDIKFLNDTIAQLQASAGQISPSDQALLDSLEARAKSAADRVAALDALTPPVVPVP